MTSQTIRNENLVMTSLIIRECAKHLANFNVIISQFYSQNDNIRLCFEKTKITWNFLPTNCPSRGYNIVLYTNSINNNKTETIKAILLSDANEKQRLIWLRQ